MNIEVGVAPESRIYPARQEEHIHTIPTLRRKRGPSYFLAVFFLFHPNNIYTYFLSNSKKRTASEQFPVLKKREKPIQIQIKRLMVAA